MSAGEDTIYLDKEKGIAVNEEVYSDEVLNDLGLEADKLEKVLASEVGNIFSLGTKFSEPIGLKYKNEVGETMPVIMGSYGIGPARVMGVVAELFADEKGIVWPESIAPFKVHLVGLGLDDDEIRDYSEGLYSQFTNADIEVLFDDRDTSAGQKFNESDLLGIPYRIVIGKKTKEEGKFEVVERSTGKVTMLTEEEVRQKFITTD